MPCELLGLGCCSQDGSIYNGHICHVLEAEIGAVGAFSDADDLCMMQY